MAIGSVNPTMVQPPLVHPETITPILPQYARFPNSAESAGSLLRSDVIRPAAVEPTLTYSHDILAAGPSKTKPHPPSKLSKQTAVLAVFGGLSLTSAAVVATVLGLHSNGRLGSSESKKPARPAQAPPNPQAHPAAPFALAR